MHKGYLKIAALLGALSVLLGAFAALGLKEIVDAKTLTMFETGIRYQFYHVFALLAVAILYKEFPNNFLQWAGRMFCLGILFFSGSLYCLTYFGTDISTGFKWLFFITPFGGLCFIIGWVLMALAVMKKN